MSLIQILLLLVVVTQPAGMPDFSGRWRMVPERSGSPTQSQPVTEMVFVIEQVADQIRLDMTSNANPTVSTTYVLGSAPKQPAEPLGADQQRAYWDGNNWSRTRRHDQRPDGVVEANADA